jgi:serine/threonine-protein kinase
MTMETPIPGMALGRVTLGQKLAESRLFHVFDGHDEEHRLRVEVTLPRRDAPEPDDLVALAREEAERLTRLQHVNICPLFRAGEQAGWFYTTSPKMDGFDLGSYDPQRQGLLDIGRVSDVMQATALALAVGHFKDISHHNICPQSIHVDARGTVRIKHYFIARIIYRHDQHRQEQDSKIRVSVPPHYISPEKAESGTEDRRGDVFSFGVLYYWLLTGRHPFDGTTTEEIVYARIPRQEDRADVYNEADRLPPYVPPLPPHEIRPEIPRQLGGLVMDMLGYYPARRPEFTEIISELNLLRAKQDMLTRRHTLLKIAQTDTRDLPKMEKHGVVKKPKLPALRAQAPAADGKRPGGAADAPALARPFPPEAQQDVPEAHLANAGAESAAV